MLAKDSHPFSHYSSAQVSSCLAGMHPESIIKLLLAFLSEKAMAPHSSTLAWKIPWTEEPGRLQSMGSLRVGHDWATSLSLFTFMHWRRKWQPTPGFLPGESQGRGEPGGLPSMGLHRIGHDWSDLAPANPEKTTHYSLCQGHKEKSLRREREMIGVEKRLSLQW